MFSMVLRTDFQLASAPRSSRLKLQGNVLLFPFRIAYCYGLVQSSTEQEANKWMYSVYEYINPILHEV